MDWGLVPRLREHVLACVRMPSLSDEEIQVLRSDLCSFLKKQRCARSETIACDQPIMLDLLKGMLQLWSDADIGLPDQVASGVPTGVLDTIPPSGIWREVEVTDRPADELLVWGEPWPSGLADPGLLMALVQSVV